MGKGGEVAAIKMAYSVVVRAQPQMALPVLQHAFYQRRGQAIAHAKIVPGTFVIASTCAMDLWSGGRYCIRGYAIKKVLLGSGSIERRKLFNSRGPSGVGG